VVLRQLPGRPRAGQPIRGGERDENLVTASRMFAALARSESGARVLESALAEVFPWARHLSAAERTEFTAELIAGWRATARIKADKMQYARALAPTEGDFGPAEVIA
jgi:hypothetical protein